MAQLLVKKDDNRVDEAEFSLVLGNEKGAILQEATVFNEPQLDSRRFSRIGNPGLRLLWHFLHFIVSIWYFAVGVVYILESYLMSSGFMKSYQALNISKLRYLAIVVESEEAYHTLEVIKLLQWLAALGVRQLCLYDTEGVLKKSKEAILENLNSATLFEESNENDTRLEQKHDSGICFLL